MGYDQTLQAQQAAQGGSPYSGMTGPNFGFQASPSNMDLPIGMSSMPQTSVNMAAQAANIPQGTPQVSAPPPVEKPAKPRGFFGALGKMFSPKAVGNFVKGATVGFAKSMWNTVKGMVKDPLKHWKEWGAVALGIAACFIPGGQVIGAALIAWGATSAVTSMAKSGASAFAAYKAGYDDAGNAAMGDMGTATMSLAATAAGARVGLKAGLLKKSYTPVSLKGVTKATVTSRVAKPRFSGNAGKAYTGTKQSFNDLWYVTKLNGHDMFTAIRPSSWKQGGVAREGIAQNKANFMEGYGNAKTAYAASRSAGTGRWGSMKTAWGEYYPYTPMGGARQAGAGTASSTSSSGTSAPTSSSSSSTSTTSTSSTSGSTASSSSTAGSTSTGSTSSSYSATGSGASNKFFMQQNGRTIEFTHVIQNGRAMTPAEMLQAGKRVQNGDTLRFAEGGVVKTYRYVDQPGQKPHIVEINIPEMPAANPSATSSNVSASASASSASKEVAVRTPATVEVSQTQATPNVLKVENLAESKAASTSTSTDLAVRTPSAIEASHKPAVPAVADTTQTTSAATLKDPGKIAATRMSTADIKGRLAYLEEEIGKSSGQARNQLYKEYNELNAELKQRTQQQKGYATSAAAGTASNLVNPTAFADKLGEMAGASDAMPWQPVQVGDAYIRGSDTLFGGSQGAMPGALGMQGAMA